MRAASEAQPGILVAAFRAFAQLGARRRGIKRVAANAVERRLAPLDLEAPMIAAVIPKPEPEKNHPDQRAIDDGGRGEIEHGRRHCGGRARGGHFQIWGLNRTRLCSSSARQSRNRKPTITRTLTAAVMMPLSENVPCTRSARLANASLPVK